MDSADSDAPQAKAIRNVPTWQKLATRVVDALSKNLWHKVIE